MKKLKLQFGLFFLLLAVAMGALLINSYHQMNREERELWSSRAEKVYNHFQSEISDFLTQEDARSFSHYRFYYMPDETAQRGVGLQRSPLSRLPRNGAPGLVGYFQIDPNGSCQTPYLPHRRTHARLRDEPARIALNNRLKEIIKPLNEDLRSESLSLQALSEEALSFESLDHFSSEELRDLRFDIQAPSPQFSRAPQMPMKSEPDAISPSQSARNVYPNPIQEQIKRRKQKKSAREEVSKKIAQQKQMARRQITAGVAQLRTFEEESMDSLDLSGIEMGALSSQGSATITITRSLVPAVPPSLYVDPFQARMVDEQDEDYLIFYRKVWLNQNLYIQGFVVELEKFYSWLMDRSFANSNLPSFSIAELSANGKALANYGNSELRVNATDLLFKRNMGYPLDNFTWKVFAAFIPHQTARVYLYGITILASR